VDFSGGELFILIIFLIPIYGLLFWAYKDPKASYLFGRRWMYKEEPEFSEESIMFLKKSAIVFIVIITLMLILTICRSFS